MFQNISHATWRIVLLLVVFWISTNLFGQVFAIPFFFLGQAGGVIGWLLGFALMFLLYRRQYHFGDTYTTEYLEKYIQVENDDGTTHGMTSYNTPKLDYMEHYLEFTQGNPFQKFLAQTGAYMNLSRSTRHQEMIGKFAQTGSETHEKKLRYVHRDNIAQTKIQAEVTSDQRTISGNYRQMEDDGFPTKKAIDTAFTGQKEIAKRTAMDEADESIREALVEQIKDEPDLQKKLQLREQLKEFDKETKELSGDTS